MAKKKAMRRTLARKKSWLLANNPRQDNSCECFHRKVPDNNWIVISRYPTAEQCRKTIDVCSTFFMKMPIKKPHRGMQD